MKNRIAIEFLSVFDLQPIAFVELTAQLGCELISCGLHSMEGGFNLNNYPAWSLREDKALRADMIRAMNDHNVRISLMDGFAVKPGQDVAGMDSDLELVVELGAQRINSYCLEPDLGRAFDQLATLAEMASRVQVELVVEFVLGLPIGNLDTAVAAIQHVDADNCGLMIDTMHLVRSGAGVSDLEKLAPDLVKYAQVCDVPMQNDQLSYMEEAMFERRVPGEGELPLVDIFAVLPQEIPVGIEIPQRSLLQRGVSDFDRLSACVAATRSILPAAP